ncbi:SMP-30/gluconolactonase/LRE family protein [Oricola indica]|jgi:sugar lactone lactonase YvrE|uniref:SMP-30/gluconolactonase/LRE family protein n=1 Tax=Oricola indica TaxID=2872591 RepID=UPI001CC00826|nr:SMP-30/gluconolactonase/LRE family protein [Oricola indica]
MNDVTILSETPCRLGEGPAYDPARETLFWFDITECRRYALHLPSGEQNVLDLPEMASAMAVIDAGRDLILTKTGLYVLDNATGALTPHVPVEADNPVTRSNDARLHPSGAFWFGTMGKKAEDGAGAIYRYFRGTVEKLYDRVTIPNAICFSPDGTAAFFTDTQINRLMRVAVDPATGALAGEPEIIHDHSDGKGGLDGAATDADGRIWNARYGAGALDCYAPDGSRLLTIDMPAVQVTCPAFVGDGLIAVTSAWQTLDAAARAADPHAGKTFLVRTDVRPKFEPAVAFAEL